MTVEDILKNVGRAVPHRYSISLERMLIYAGLERMPELLLGFMVLFAVMLGALFFLLATQIGGLSQYAFLVALCGLLVFPFAYLYLTLRIDMRKQQVEAVLPDFLQLAAANVRAGMPVDQAMWQAARPEFGLLSQEITIVAKLTFGGEPFAQTLDKLGERFDSKNLQRTIRLIKQGLASGGEMADILEETAIDIRNGQIIRKEISATLLMYVIFIVFASTLGAPFLYAVSYKMINVLEKVWVQLPDLSSGSAQVPTGATFLTPKAPTITSQQFLIFALIASFVTGFFASIIIAVIRVGSKKHFVRYFPLFLGIMAFAFFMIIVVLDSFFAGIVK
ncbi:Type II secretion system (T2SS), protein F [uncultured archaeon]|nr:Type II secretion system (T2SS), protein F [uncultured archaeon]